MKEAVKRLVDYRAIGESSFNVSNVMDIHNPNEMPSMLVARVIGKSKVGALQSFI
jgi:hypothetical protein